MPRKSDDKKRAERAIAKQAHKHSKRKKYETLKKPRTPHPKGLFALKAKHGKQLGVKCIICNDTLHPKPGRKRIMCKKKSCFKAVRAAYRYDWDNAA